MVCSPCAQAVVWGWAGGEPLSSSCQSGCRQSTLGSPAPTSSTPLSLQRALPSCRLLSLLPLQEHPQRLNPCPQRPLCQASVPAEAAPAAAAGGKRGGGAAAARPPTPPRLLCSQRNQVDLWQLGTAAGGQLGGRQGEAAEVGEGAMVSPGTPPLHLARFETKGGGFLTAAALAPAGNMLVFSDARKVRAFQLAERPLPEGPEGAVSPPGLAAALAVTPLPLPADLPPASHLAFVPGAAGGSSSLVACALDGTVRVVDLSAHSGGAAGAAGAADEGDDPPAAAQQQQQHPGGVLVIRDIHNLRHKMWAKRERHKSAARRLAPALDLLSASPDGRWLAVAARQRVHLVDLRAARPSAVQLPPPCDPPRPITALAFTADSATLLAAAAGPLAARSARAGCLGTREGRPEGVHPLAGPCICCMWALQRACSSRRRARSQAGGQLCKCSTCSAMPPHSPCM